MNEAWVFQHPVLLPFLLPMHRISLLNHQIFVAIAHFYPSLWTRRQNRISNTIFLILIRQQSNDNLGNTQGHP